MQAQTADFLALEAYAGLDYSTSLQSTFTLDTNTGSFSYSLDPGQTYLGQAFSLSGSGIYDSGTTTFDWTDSGELGSDAWAGSGQLQWTGDDPSAVGPVKIQIDNTTFTLTLSVNVHPTGKATGTSDGTMILNDGKKNHYYDVKDSYAPYTWSATIVDTNGNTGYGTATWKYNKDGTTTSTWTVPEPASIWLVVTGLLPLVNRMRHRKQQSAFPKPYPLREVLRRW